MKRAKFFLLLVVLMTFPMIQNCGGSSNGGGTSNLIVSDRLINEGWDAIKLGNYATAKASFENALKEPLTEGQRVSAHSGMGWALSKSGKILESIPYFEIAAEKDNEAKVGLAGALGRAEDRFGVHRGQARCADAGLPLGHRLLGVVR